MANGDMVCYNILKYSLDVGFGKGRAKNSKIYTCSGGRLRVPKILVGPVGVFLTYGDGLYSHICLFFAIYI